MHFGPIDFVRKAVGNRQFASHCASWTTDLHRCRFSVLRAKSHDQSGDSFAPFAIAVVDISLTTRGAGRNSFDDEATLGVGLDILLGPNDRDVAMILVDRKLCADDRLIPREDCP